MEVMIFSALLMAIAIAMIWVIWHPKEGGANEFTTKAAGSLAGLGLAFVLGYFFGTYEVQQQQQQQLSETSSNSSNALLRVKSIRGESRL